jgi:hypothetical protein
MFHSISESEVGDHLTFQKRKLKTQQQFQPFLEIPELLDEIFKFLQPQEFLVLSKTCKQFYKQIKSSIPYRNKKIYCKLKKCMLSNIKIVDFEIPLIAELQFTNEILFVEMVCWHKMKHEIFYKLINKEEEIISDLTLDPPESTLSLLKKFGWSLSNMCDSDLKIIMTGMLSPAGNPFYDLKIHSIFKKSTELYFKVDLIEDYQDIGEPIRRIDHYLYCLAFEVDSIKLSKIEFSFTNEEVEIIPKFSTIPSIRESQKSEYENLHDVIFPKNKIY